MINPDNPEVFTSPKIISLEQAAQRIKDAKAQGKKVGLCHGGFDLLHPGHIKHFESAKKICDGLIVSVTSDRFVAGRKGSGRPVFPDTLRAYSIAALECVDYVIVTDVEKAVPILEQLQPSYYIKGPDFIGKTTPGITSEREAIVRVRGEMKYTDDPKLGTTEIIDYIKNRLDIPELLLIIDRDGTLIHDDGYFGRKESWKEDLRFNDNVVSYLSDLQTKYKTTKLVVTNQAGVARGYFDCARVEEVHAHLHTLLASHGVKIDRWEYCPDVDTVYAQMMKEVSFDPCHVKERTKRKPHPDMVLDGLGKLQRKREEFATVIVLGDRPEDDGGLAVNIQGKFIDVRGKNIEDLKKEFS